MPRTWLIEELSEPVTLEGGWVDIFRWSDQRERKKDKDKALRRMRSPPERPFPPIARPPLPHNYMGFIL